MDVDRTATHDALALARDTLAAAETLGRLKPFPGSRAGAGW